LMAKKISGVITAMITPRAEDGPVDDEAVKRLVDYLVDSGVDAIFPTGSAGEGPILSLEEKKQVIESVVEAVDGRVPVLPGIACTTTKDTVDLGRFCDDLGVDAVVVVTPWYYALSDDALLSHYSTIARELESPIIAYKIPQCAVNDISLDLLDKLSKLEGIAGVKDSSGNIEWLSRAIMMHGETLSFYGGDDRLILPCLSVGASGHVSGSSNCFPEEVVGVYRSFVKGDLDGARRWQQRLLRLVSLFPRGKENSAIREILRYRGIETGEPLPPMGILSEEERETIRSTLRRLESGA